MNRVFTEENERYQIDCSEAVWATEELHVEYTAAHSSLNDVDWIMESQEKLYLEEYKKHLDEILKKIDTKGVN